MYFPILLETFNVTGPIFVLVMLGLVLKRIRFFDDNFVQISSKLVFNICLPVLLFTTISKVDLDAQFNLDVFNLSTVGACITFGLSWLVAIVVISPRVDRGVFVQGCFRSNLGVVGLALCSNAYGAAGLAMASILMAGMTVTYNILSVVVLSYYRGNHQRYQGDEDTEGSGRASNAIDWRQILLDIITNPLIIAIILAILVALFRIPLPSILLSAGGYLGQVALPLALMSTGAGLSIKAIRSASFNTLLAVLMKSTILPLVVTLIAMALGFTGIALGVLFLLFASPTATASFIMVKGMGGNDTLASNIVVLSTVVSVLTCSLGFFLLKVLSLV